MLFRFYFFFVLYTETKCEFFFFFQAEDGIRDGTVTEFRRVLFRSGESFYREPDFDKAATEFEAFLAFYPRHQIADLVQFRLAMSYYDQIKPIEQEQAFAQKAMEQFKKLVKEYPECRYATAAIAKIEVCRGRP